MDGYRVEEYYFTDKAEAAAAAKELKAINYLRNQLKDSSPKALADAYSQLISQGVFKTAAGFDFLNDLLDEIEDGGGDISSLPEIPESVRDTDDSAKLAAMKKRAAQKKAEQAAGERQASGVAQGDPTLREQLEKYRNRSLALSVVCVILLLTVIAMFVITLTANLPNVLNYRTKIENEYSVWEQELTEKERELNERERLLNNAELQNMPPMTDSTQGADGQDSFSQGANQ